MTTNRRPWTPEELDLLTDETKTTAELAVLLGRTRSSINSRRGLLVHRHNKETGAKREYRPWTDYESGLAGDERLPLEEVARLTGRSIQACNGKRKNLRRGRGGKENLWAEWELNLLRDAWEMPNKELLKLFPHRSPTSVKGARQRLIIGGDMHATDRQRDNPHTVGSRKLLAKTCLKCGLLMDSRWFQFNTQTKHWSPNCTACRRGRDRTRDRESYKQNRATVIAQERARKAVYRKLTTPARRNGQEWTSQDFEQLSDPSKTILEKAILLERTWAATSAMASKCGYKSEVGHLGDQQDGVWNIEFPAAEAALAHELATAA